MGIALSSMMGIVATAQAPSDAYRNAQEELSGTARAQALSGAIGAFGADASAISINPAGIGLYTTPTLSFTIEAGQGRSNSIWTNQNDSFESKNKWAIGTVNNFSISSPLIRRSADRSWNLNWGFTYNRNYDNRRNYGMINSAPAFGITDYFAFEASRIGAPWDTEYITPIIDIARDARWIEAFTHNKTLAEGKEHRYRTTFSATVPGYNPEEGVYYLFTPAASELSVKESGYRNNYDMNIGMGFSDRYYIGATLKINSFYTSRVASYQEDFVNDYNNQLYESNLNYTTGLTTAGNSVGLNVGGLFAIGDFGRIGISYMLPQLAYFNEVYWAKASGNNAAFQGNEFVSKTIEDQESSYKALIPGRLSVSALAFMGRFGFVSYDYQMRNLGSSKLFDPNGNNELSESEFISEDFGLEHSHHIGLEVRPVSMLALRAGYSYTGNPMKAEQLRNAPENSLAYNYVPSGYITDFVIPRSYQTISAGVGFNLGRRTTLDLAYVYGKRTEKAYPYSGSSATGMLVDQKEVIDGKEVITEVPQDTFMDVIGANLTTNKHKFVATLNFRF